MIKLPFLFVVALLQCWYLAYESKGALHPHSELDFGLGYYNVTFFYYGEPHFCFNTDQYDIFRRDVESFLELTKLGQKLYRDHPIFEQLGPTLHLVYNGANKRFQSHYPCMSNANFVLFKSKMNVLHSQFTNRSCFTNRDCRFAFRFGLDELNNFLEGTVYLLEEHRQLQPFPFSTMRKFLIHILKHRVRLREPEDWEQIKHYYFLACIIDGYSPLGLLLDLDTELTKESLAKLPRFLQLRLVTEDNLNVIDTTPADLPMEYMEGCPLLPIGPAKATILPLKWRIYELQNSLSDNDRPRWNSAFERALGYVYRSERVLYPITLRRDLRPYEEKISNFILDGIEHFRGQKIKMLENGTKIYTGHRGYYFNYEKILGRKCNHNVGHAFYVY